MKKKFLSVALCGLMLVTSFFTGCASESVLWLEEEETKINVEVRKVSVEEAVASAETDFQDAKNQYSNLKMKNIHPYCNDLKTVANLEYYHLGNYKGITEPIEMYNELLALIHLHLGENLIEDNFLTAFTSDIRPEKKYDTFQEYKEALFSGEESEVIDLSYIGATKEYASVYCEMQEWLANLILDKKVRYEDVPDEVKQVGANGKSTMEEEKIATYYVNDLDNNLDDVYQLKNGTMSIRDSIVMVEDFLNHKTGVEGSADVKFKVERVDVYKVVDAYCFFEYRINRVIFGLPGVIDRNRGNYTGLDFENSYAYVACTDELDGYIGRTTIFPHKKIKEMEQILPLSEALRIVSDSIGENSSYEVKSISLGYMDESVRYTGEAVDEEDAAGTMYASWIVECDNMQDLEDTVFYVNVDTGAIRVQTWS